MKLLIACLLILLMPQISRALEPSEVAVVCNSFVEESTELAEYYMKARNIPGKNLIKIRPTANQSIGREDFEDDILKPVRKALLKRFNPGEIRALVVMYRVPLSVGPPRRTDEEEKRYRELGARRGELREALKDESEPERKKAKQAELKKVEKELKELRKDNYRAAVDSELMLVLAENYPLANWVPNPYFLGNQKTASKLPVTKEAVLMVSRLDGPSTEIVKRIIDDSLAAEKEGLSGTAYFDARYARPEKTDVSGSAFYDLSIHLAAERVRKSGRMPVVVDDQSRLFQPGEAPDAALYCGWYSLARYVDAFTWQQGAIGYHIASQECQTLRGGNSQVWCKRMLEEGAAAVIGPVGEPYAQAFPVPEAFFSLLVDGYYTLGESYLLSLPWLSWKMVMVGDPLYRPFGGGR